MYNKTASQLSNLPLHFHALCGWATPKTPTTSKQLFLFKFSQTKYQLLLNFLEQKKSLSFWLHIRAIVHCYFASCMKIGVPRTSFLCKIPCRKWLHQLLVEYDTTGTERAAAFDSQVSSNSCWKYVACK